MNIQNFSKNRIRKWQLYLMVLPVLAYFIIFNYAPMYGVQIAFKDFNPSRGIWGSKWVGFEHFLRFFGSYRFSMLVRNTIMISVLELIFGFPIPIILALLLNEVPYKGYKKFVQTVTYAPHFISTVVLVGMLTVFLSPTYGVVNKAITAFGGNSIYFFADPDWFRPVYIISGIWQHTGWGSIIYVAALAGISPELHEVAMIDGAGRLRRIWHINIPGILPTIIILFIMNTGRIMSVGFEKVFLMQTSVNMPVSEVISTFVYKTGLLGAQFSFTAAVGLFNSVINLFLLIAVNSISRKVSETSLW